MYLKSIISKNDTKSHIYQLVIELCANYPLSL